MNPSGETTTVKNSIPADDDGSFPASFRAPLDELARDLSRIASGNYVARMKEAMIEMRETISREVTERMRKEADANFRSAIDGVRQQFQDRLQQTQSDFERERAQLLKELETLKRTDVTAKLQSELNRTNQALQNVTAEIAQMLDDPDVELAKVIRQNAVQNEMKAYARGLSYQLSIDQGSVV
ncbi:MAG TPA: hypothetical protein VGK48_07885 [Terriglobia bacterium]|jgi:hypothetical protein